VLGVAFTQSGRLLATAGQDADVHVWKARNGQKVTDLTGQFAIVSGAVFSPDSRWIVSAGPGSAGLWDLAEQQRLLFLDGHKGKLLAATFVAGGRRIETVGVDGTIRAYECGVCGRVPELLRLAAARLAATGRRLTPEDAQTLGIG
jgi:WD40 repeat protein